MLRSLRKLCCSLCAGPEVVELDLQELLSDASEHSASAAARVVGWQELQQVRHLAQGSFCDVWEATLDGEPVAVKKLRVEQESNAVALRDLENEAHIMSQLAHPNVLRVLGTGRVAGRRRTELQLPFVVLERLQAPLSALLPRPVGEVAIWERLAAAQRWPMRRSLLAGLQLAQALRYLLEEEPVAGMRVLHRDLKPDNLGVLRSGRLVLLDFGLAKLWEVGAVADTEPHRLTGETGSARYMAPEVALSLPYDHSAECFSFSLILWQLCAHERPFAGMPADSFASRVATDGVRPSIPADWPDGLRALLQACWHAEPGRRPDFKSVVRELHALLQGRPVDHILEE